MNTDLLDDILPEGNYYSEQIKDKIELLSSGGDSVFTWNLSDQQVIEVVKVITSIKGDVFLFLELLEYNENLNNHLARYDGDRKIMDRLECVRQCRLLFESVGYEDRIHNNEVHLFLNLIEDILI